MLPQLGQAVKATSIYRARVSPVGALSAATASASSCEWVPFICGHKLLHPRVATVHDEHATPRVDYDAVGEIELALAVAEPAPLRDVVAFTVEFLNSLIPGLRYVHIAMTIDGDTPWRTQLPGFLGLRTARVAGTDAASPTS